MTRTIENNESIWFWKQKSEEVTSNPSLPSASGWHQFEKLMLRFFMIQFGARFQTEKEPQNASECQICITFHQIQNWCLKSNWDSMLSNWLVGQGWNSVFYGNIFVLRHSFFRTFWLKFLWTQISDGDACWRKWWYVQFFRAVLFQFRKFRAILIKMQRLQLVTDREVGLGWKQRGSWINFFANNFIEKHHSPLW